MPRKKPPNWEEIETRYIVNGEKPSDIAKDYNVTAKTISNAAWEGDWEEKRGKLGKELRELAIYNKKKLVEEAYEIYGMAFAVIRKHMLNAKTPFTEDRINPLFLEPMKLASKLIVGERGEDDDDFESRVVEVEGLEKDRV